MKTKKIAVTIAMLLLSFALLFFIFNKFIKKKDTDIAGGPCSYDTNEYPIIITEIDSFDDSTFDITCANYSYPQFDSVFYYYQTNNTYATISDIAHLSIGDTVCLLEHNIVSGACSPHLISIKLEKCNKPTDGEERD